MLIPFDMQTRQLRGLRATSAERGADSMVSLWCCGLGFCVQAAGLCWVAWSCCVAGLCVCRARSWSGPVVACVRCCAGRCDAAGWWLVSAACSRVSWRLRAACWCVSAVLLAGLGCLALWRRGWEAAGVWLVCCGRVVQRGRWLVPRPVWSLPIGWRCGPSLACLCWSDVF